MCASRDEILARCVPAECAPTDRIFARSKVKITVKGPFLFTLLGDSINYISAHDSSFVSSLLLVKFAYVFLFPQAIL